LIKTDYGQIHTHMHTYFHSKLKGQDYVVITIIKSTKKNI